MQHPSDGETWKHFDRIYPEFVAEAIYVRLRLCFDDFTPYIQASRIEYSCWLVIVTPCNLLREICMTKSYMFLTCLIPRLSSIRAGIDVYL